MFKIGQSAAKTFQFIYIKGGDIMLSLQNYIDKFYDTNTIDDTIKWKPVMINGEISKYNINTRGEIISLHKKSPKFINGHITNNGYRIFCLKHHKKDYWVLAHRLVALTFIEIPENLCNIPLSVLEVNHKDGDKLNNIIDNLEWVTPSDNLKHAYKNDLKKDCENHYNAKYTNKQIHNLCKLLSENKLSRMELVKETSVDDSTIGEILAGNQWKKISNKYDFSNRKKKHTNYPLDVKNKAIDLINLKNNGYNISYADIGRKVGMSRTSVWYLATKINNR